MHTSIRPFVPALALVLSICFFPVHEAQAQCTFTNGNFETGNLTGWTVYSRVISGPGNIANWYNYTGTSSPLSIHSVSAPPQGTRGAVADQNQASVNELHQDFTLPAGQSGTLTFFLAYNNTLSSFITLNTLDFVGNQQARVDLLKTTAPNESVAASDVYAKLFQTKPGDPATMAPTVMTFDVSGFAGLTTRLRFAESVGFSWLNLQIDNVCLSTTRGTLTRTTPTGLNVKPSFGGVELTLPSVTVAGTTSLQQLDPAAQTGPPAGQTFIGPAYDISTTATYTGQARVCLLLPGIPNPTFSHLRLLHKEGGVWVDVASSRINPATRQLCGFVNSLSPFAVGNNPSSPTAAGAQITGRITDPSGAPVAGAVVKLTGAQSRKFITDADGNYRFDNVQTDSFYTVSPSRTNYSFTPSERSFSQIGSQTDAAFTALPNGAQLNLLDTSEYFVRQHYLDFLGREPDEVGFNFWSDQISSCGIDDGDCAERRRINVSAAYFLSTEFQQTGGLANALYRASFGRSPVYAEFIPDAGAIAREIVVGHEGWREQLATNKRDFVAEFIQRAEFREVYGGLTNDCFVDALLAQRGVSFSSSEREGLVNGLTARTLTRGEVLQRLAENEIFVATLRNEAFVMMQYFGYLRRDPDPNGYHFWLNKLNQFQGNFEQAEMVKAFINSSEYRARFAK